MNDVKSFLKSKTIWGAAITVAPSVAGLFGYTITGADVATANDAINSIVTAVGSLLAIYGRVTARARIG
jgi:uncharacterized membrane protein